MNMLFGQISQGVVPAEENVVRYPSAPVNVAKDPAVMDDPPEMGEVQTDPDPNLGMATRQLASDWHQQEKYSPFWADNASQQAVNSVRIDGTQASSGTAAQREVSGQFGHGTYAFAVGIEPVQGLAEGGQFGNTYFAIPKPPVQETMGRYMTQPPGYSHGEVATAAQLAERRSREAFQASLYDTFLHGNG